MRSSLKLVRDALLGLAYPANCQLCGQTIETWDDGVVCGDCWTDPEITILFGALPVCFRCGYPLRMKPAVGPIPNSNLEATMNAPKFCGTCDELPLHSLRSLGMYQGALEASVLFMKSSPHIFPRLYKLVTEACAGSSADLSSDLIMPIPLHPARKRQRGFNQASVIARGVARILALPVDEKRLVRIKQTERHRAGMDRFDRAKSIADAFAVTDPARLKGLRVLLVDDLCTTGSTLGEAASVLLAAGVMQVRGFTIGRAASPVPIQK